MYKRTREFTFEIGDKIRFSDMTEYEITHITIMKIILDDNYFYDKLDLYTDLDSGEIALIKG